MAGFNPADYVDDVAERIRMFATKYPEGSLQSEIVFQTTHRITTSEVTDPPTGVLCKAYLERHYPASGAPQRGGQA